MKKNNFPDQERGFGGPIRFPKIFQKTQCTKKSFPFLCCSGCSKGAHLPMIIWCLLLWAWFAQILMVGENLGAQYKLNYPIVFGALLWGCSKGAHLQMFIYCLLSWAWLDQILLFCRESWNTQLCHVCVLGWLGPNKSLAHALIC